MTIKEIEAIKDAAELCQGTNSWQDFPEILEAMKIASSEEVVFSLPAEDEPRELRF